MNKFELINKELIEKIAQSDGNWISQLISSSVARNYMTKHEYQGFNRILTDSQFLKNCYIDNQWLTFKQAKELGGFVKKGEKGVWISYFGNLIDELTQKKKWFLKHSFVFNIYQIDGIEFKTEEIENKNDNIKKIDQFIKNTGAQIQHKKITPCFIHSQDKIALPTINEFTNEQAFYSTLLHELTHWTGAKNRLDRNQRGRFGSDNYAFEELVAEIGSAYLCSHLGLDIQNNQHPEYLKSWLKILKNDYKVLVRASTLAQQSTNYLIKLAEVSSQT